jgi:hypothetical protein
MDLQALAENGGCSFSLALHMHFPLQGSENDTIFALNG